MSDPAGVDPEEALIASASACHMLWFLALAHKAGLDIASYEDDASAALEKNEEGKIALSRITLRPRIIFIGRQPAGEEIDHLHHEAHERCFIANSLRSEIVVAPPGE
jgi:organic hydroperoxide reductase OsmC/OhrA